VAESFGQASFCLDILCVSPPEVTTPKTLKQLPPKNIPRMGDTAIFGKIFSSCRRFRPDYGGPPRPRPESGLLLPIY